MANLARTTSAKRARATADVEVELAELRGPLGLTALTLPEAAIRHVELHLGDRAVHRLLLTQLGAVDVLTKAK